MLLGVDGKPIGGTPEEAAVIAIQTIASRGREVLVALETIGIRVPLPVEIRAGNQVAKLDRDGIKLEKIERAKRGPKPAENGKEAAATPPAATGIFAQRDLAAQVKSDPASAAASIVAGMAQPPSFP